MKRILSLLLVLISMILTLPACGNVPMSTAQLTQHTANSSVALVYYDVDNDSDQSDIRPFCSGTWVDDTHILTAYHCAKGLQRHLQEVQDEKEARRKPCEGLATLFGMCDTNTEHKVIDLDDLPMHYIVRPEVDQMGTEPTAWHLSKLVSWDATHDLALLQAQGKAVPPHEVAQLADKSPALGEKVVVVGHPAGYYWTYLTGTVSGYRETFPGTERGPFLQVQVPVFYGNSGGGVFNEYGQLVGVVDTLPKLPAEGLCIALPTVKSFLKQAPVLSALRHLHLGN